MQAHSLWFFSRVTLIDIFFFFEENMNQTNSFIQLHSHCTQIVSWLSETCLPGSLVMKRVYFDRKTKLFFILGNVSIWTFIFQSTPHHLQWNRTNTQYTNFLLKHIPIFARSSFMFFLINKLVMFFKHMLDLASIGWGQLHTRSWVIAKIKITFQVKTGTKWLKLTFSEKKNMFSRDFWTLLSNRKENFMMVVQLNRNFYHWSRYMKDFFLVKSDNKTCEKRN